MSNPTETTYDLNTQELIEASKAFLNESMPPTNKRFNADEFVKAWQRLDKAVKVMEAQESEVMPV